jgi:hypothetical protein
MLSSRPGLKTSILTCTFVVDRVTGIELALSANGSGERCPGCPELGLALDVQDGWDVGVCAEMAEYFVEAVVQRAVRDGPA